MTLSIDHIDSAAEATRSLAGPASTPKESRWLSSSNLTFMSTWDNWVKGDRFDADHRPIDKDQVAAWGASLRERMEKHIAGIRDGEEG